MLKRATLCSAVIPMAVLSLIAVSVMPTQARADKLSSLIDLWMIENSKCRGGSGDEQSTWDACDRREGISRKIEALGYTYGCDDDYGYQRYWRNDCGHQKPAATDAKRITKFSFRSGQEDWGLTCYLEANSGSTPIMFFVTSPQQHAEIHFSSDQVGGSSGDVAGTITIGARSYKTTFGPNDYFGTISGGLPAKALNALSKSPSAMVSVGGISFALDFKSAKKQLTRFMQCAR